MSNEIVKASEITREIAQLEKPLQIKDLLEQVNLIQQVMRDVMKEGEHYGVIPGTSGKPSLLKPGAEKISFVFRLAPEYEVIEQELGDGHLKYRVMCTLRTPNGLSKGQGVGTCSTMESKYRFRSGPKEATGQPVPHEYWNTRKTEPMKALELIGGKGHVVAKEDGIWQIFRQGEKVEHDNPADHYNTALKMAKKRAHVDAVLTATAASDIFTQDVEEISENLKAVRGEEIEQDKPKENTHTYGKRSEMSEINLPPNAPADWREVGVAAEGPSHSMALGELEEEKLDWLFSNWIPARLAKAASKPITTAERAMIDAVLERERQKKKKPAKPMTSVEYQEAQERQHTGDEADEIPMD